MIVKDGACNNANATISTVVEIRQPSKSKPFPRNISVVRHVSDRSRNEQISLGSERERNVTRYRESHVTIERDRFNVDILQLRVLISCFLVCIVISVAMVTKCPCKTEIKCLKCYRLVKA